MIPVSVNFCKLNCRKGKLENDEIDNIQGLSDGSEVEKSMRVTFF